MAAASWPCACQWARQTFQMLPAAAAPPLCALAFAELPSLGRLERWWEELRAPCTAIGCLGRLMSAFATGEHGPSAAGGDQAWRETQRRLYAGVPGPLLRLGAQLEAGMGRMLALSGPLREAATGQAAEFLVRHMSTMDDAAGVRFCLPLRAGQCLDRLAAPVAGAVLLTCSRAGLLAGLLGNASLCWLVFNNNNELPCLAGCVLPAGNRHCCGPWLPPPLPPAHPSPAGSSPEASHHAGSDAGACVCVRAPPCLLACTPNAPIACPPMLRLAGLLGGLRPGAASRCRANLAVPCCTASCAPCCAGPPGQCGA